MPGVSPATDTSWGSLTLSGMNELVTSGFFSARASACYAHDKPAGRRLNAQLLGGLVQVFGQFHAPIRE